MSRLISRPGLAGLIIVSACMGYVLFHYQQERVRQSAPQTTAQVDLSAAVAPIVGHQRPDFSLPDLDGQMRSISEWDGKVIALNFWATWCPPCLKEVPEFVSLQSRYQAQGLQFIGIALQKPEEVREFVTEHKVNYPILAGELEVIKLAEAYGNHIGALPYTVIIDRNGQIAHVKPGILPTEEAESIISGLL